MSSSINKKELEHLASLARLKLDPNEEEKLLTDLGAILDHVKELQSVDTANVEPMTGGTNLKNVFREDGAEKGGPENTDRGAGVDAFPESEDGFLKIPPVFE